ncbi:MAG TPA: nucleotidyltransferase family protein [Candidatus Binataceae bacterium]|nr:nucleotidyltransferase family protein [Candidatus Binataceae bacterium]
MAAGESRRMGYPKPLLEIDGETFVARLVRLMLPVVARLTVVVGAHADRVRPAIPRDDRISIVENPDWPRGQLSSIKAGLRALPSDASAAMVHLADHPRVKASTFDAVAEAYRASGKPIAIPRNNGHRGHPVIFGRTVFAELLEAPEDQGARVVVNADPSRIVYIDLDDAGILLDLDTPEELSRAGLRLPADR